MHFDEEMGFQYLGPGITVLSPSDPRPPTVRFDSIVVLAGGRRAGRRWVRTFKRRFGISGRRLPLDEPVSADHVQAKAGPGPIFGTFFWPLSRRILFETTQILEPFWFLFLGRELYQVTAFYHLLDDLAAQVGPEKMHVLAECRWNKS